MNHADVQHYMASYLDGELALAKRALFDAHLDTCAACEGEVEEFRATISLLRALPTPEPPPDLVDNVMRQIRAGEAQPNWIVRVQDWLADLEMPTLMVPATAAAAAVAVALVMNGGQLPWISPAGDEASAPIAAVDSVVSPESSEFSPPPASPSPVAAGQRFARVEPELPNRDMVRLETTPGRPALIGASVMQEDVGAPPMAMRKSPMTIPSLSSDLPENATRDERRNAALDGRLEYLVQNPSEFTGAFAQMTLAERELWLAVLSERAVEQGRTLEVISSLRRASDIDARLLAEAFEVTIEGIEPTSAP